MLDILPMKPLMFLSRILENCDRVSETIVVRDCGHEIDLINSNQVCRSHRAESVKVDALTLLYTCHLLLAVVCRQASRIIIVEEGIHPGTICVDVGDVENTQTPGFWTIDHEAVREGRIVPLC